MLETLQSVLNAAARLVFGSRMYEHVTPILHDLHWLRVPELISFWLAELVHRCQHGLVQPYLANELQRVADIESQQRRRSASTTALVIVPSTSHSTIDDRAFSVAQVWNSLPQLVTSSPSLTIFRRRLKTELLLGHTDLTGNELLCRSCVYRHCV